MTESLVTPGNIKSFLGGVISSFSPFLFFQKINKLHAPISVIKLLYSHKIYEYPNFATFSYTIKVGA